MRRNGSGRGGWIMDEERRIEIVSNVKRGKRWGREENRTVDEQWRQKGVQSKKKKKIYNVNKEKL